MTRALTSSQIAVVLSLNIVAISDKGSQIATLPLANLTPILSTLWLFCQQLDRLVVTLAHAAARIVYTAESTWAGVTICLTLTVILALAFGWAMGCQKPLSKTLVKNYFNSN